MAAGRFDSLEAGVDTVVESTTGLEEPDQETEVNRGMEPNAAVKSTE